MAQSVARQWPALPEANPESLKNWAAQITKLLQDGSIASTATIDALDDLFLTPAEGDTAYVNVTGDTMTGALVVSRTAVNSSYITALATEDGAASGPQFNAQRISASPGGGDLIGRYLFRGRDSGANDTDYAYLQGRIDDPTNGSEDASILLGRMVAGATVEEVIQTAGKQSIWIPAPAWKASTTSGAAAVTLELAATNQEIVSFDFDQTTVEAIHAKIAMPKSWDVGTLSCKFYWSHPATVTNFGVRWQLAAHAFSNDDAMNSNYTNVVEVTDTGGTTNDLYISDETGALTIGNTPAAEDLIALRVERRPADAADTLAVDAKFQGLMLYYTTSAPNDR